MVALILPFITNFTCLQNIKDRDKQPNRPSHVGRQIRSDNSLQLSPTKNGESHPKIERIITGMKVSFIEKKVLNFKELLI